MNFCIFDEFDRGSGDERLFELAEDRATTDVAVEQIRRGIALKRDHFIEIEHVIGQTMVGQLGEFHGADANQLSEFSAFFIGVESTALIDGEACGGDRVIENIGELRQVTRAG